ncbi:MAG: damage-inducible protein CinA [Betaproteobacteria bacterium HGW-Betaproteobacteria-1]|jgi:nicotinamide-nucleotide amidase|nr:MAG: damage-inducible protein CinA [Betaproteobacteria bacterium HGW-Betaproteobacteria-1]
MDDDVLLKLSATLGQALQQRGWTLAMAESCTGGMAAQFVTAIPGSSAWFDASFVTYSNRAKIDMLAVNPQTLEQYGAVSEETALEMATGALNRSHADIAAAITGIAGPDGGSAEKPVGMVCFAWVTADGLKLCSTYRFSGDRETVRKESVKTVFERLMSLTLTLDL